MRPPTIRLVLTKAATENQRHIQLSNGVWTDSQ